MLYAVRNGWPEMCHTLFLLILTVQVEDSTLLELADYLDAQ